MWSRIRGQLRGREEKDEDENDTILSRAFLRYYAPEVPNWLASSVPETTSEPERVYQSEPYAAQPQSSRARVFERTESFSSRTVSTATGAFKSTARTGAKIVTKPTSGLASRLKNTHW